MTRYNPCDIPAGMPESDRDLILQANEQNWESIEEDAAQTEEARAILHDIAISKYRREEYRCGMS